MDAKTRISVFASSALVCLGLMFSPVSSAGDQPVSLRYAGSGWITHVDGFVGDSSNVDLTIGTGKGTFGEFTIAITTEFTPVARATCPDAFPIEYALIYSSTVLTFDQDQSQLFGVSYAGKICANEDGQYFGEVSGDYVGGTGRLEATSGNWVSSFDGLYLEPNLHFRSIRGTVNGSIHRK